MLPVVHLGPLAFPTPSLFILLGYWISLEVVGRQGERLGLNRHVIFNAGFYAAMAGIIGGRLGFVLLHWSIFRENLIAVVALNAQALHPIAGIASGLLVGAFYLKQRGSLNRSILDSIATGLAVFLSAIALANFAGGTGMGTPSQVPWAINQWGVLRHPFQLYELGSCLFIMLILWRKSDSGRAPGSLFLLFLVLYGSVRLMIEPFRASSLTGPGGIRIVQVAGWSVSMMALYAMRIWNTIHESRSDAVEQADIVGSS